MYQTVRNLCNYAMYQIFIVKFYALQEAFESGRPLKVIAINEIWHYKKKAIRTAQQMMEKYNYLFDDATNRAFLETSKQLKANWKELKAIKEEYETILPKVTQY